MNRERHYNPHPLMDQTHLTGLPAAVATRADLDRLLAACTNWERVPEFHAGRVRFDLVRMREYVERLGHPERASPVVHVTGSKGKGSTAAIVAWLLARLGRRVGLHTSPHLHAMEERVLVDFRPIDEAGLLHATNALLRAGRSGRDELPFPTFFEFITLAAFLAFRERCVEFAVHEVGMGGALDATNVVTPAAVAITNVSLEHTAVLGDTVEAIAHEKSGIVKPSAPVVTALRDGDRALPVVAAAANRAGVALHRLGHDVVIERVERTEPSARNGARGLSIDVRTWRDRYRGLAPSLLGLHQADNVAVALGLVEVLREAGLVRASAEEVVAALDGFRMPARLEPIATDPVVIVDGAHTPESVEIACREAFATFGNRRRIVVFAMADDKDRARAARALADVDLVITTSYGSPRATDPAVLASAVTACGGRARITSDSESAVSLAREMAEKGGLVLVLGSLYLAAEVRGHVLGADRAASSLWQPIREGRPWSS